MKKAFFQIQTHSITIGYKPPTTPNKTKILNIKEQQTQSKKQELKKQVRSKK